MAWTKKSSVPHCCFDRVEHRVDRVAMSSTSHGSRKSRADRLRQRLDALAQRLALIGEGELGALRGERLGNAPGDRVVVGDAHDQPALALHQSGHVKLLSC